MCHLGNQEEMPLFNDLFVEIIEPPYLITRIFRTKAWVLVIPVNGLAKFQVYGVMMRLRKDVIQHGFLGER